MAAVGRAGSFGSSSASGVANNASAELRAGGEEDDGQNLCVCQLFHDHSIIAADEMLLVDDTDSSLAHESFENSDELWDGAHLARLLSCTPKTLAAVMATSRSLPCQHNTSVESPQLFVEDKFKKFEYFGEGEDGAGKTSLIGKIQGIEEYKKGRGMEYLYLNVHDEDRDDQTRCNVRILDGDLYHKGLLKFALESHSLKDTLIMLVVDMSRPWTAMDSLQKWASVVREHIDKLKIPPEEMKEMEQKLVRDFQEYVEPGEDFPASPQRRNTSLQEDKDDSVILPLGADTLTCNLGIPVVVVCTKCDAISVLEKEHDYRDEHFDFIQSHIRRFCLQCWDNDKKIGILHENFQTLKAEDSFEDSIRKPPVRKFVHEKEIVAEDDQVFLMKQQDASPRVPGGSPRTPNRSVTSNVASVTPIPTGSKKIDPNMKAGATSEGVLANFFNSLLSKKTGSPGGPGGVGGSPGGGNSGGTGSSLPPSAKKSGQKPVLTDVQAELDRISRKPEMVSPTSPTSPTEGEAS
ncbi:hypothetical protein ASZ78_001476 [Callipepla squamata]|uniref:Dynein light intermediate chain n=1 Tax=Callipepla squamata TaxID=9009 RepID=A0A226MFZ8_CALSU|nr:hypothetical protein ASZ78_001476 [Callipepla squamata]